MGLKTDPERRKSLLVPLLTPFYRGAFDARSLRTLMRSCEPHVSGFVPCLSSGEGQFISDDVWRAVVTTARRSTTKPVIAGIKRPSLREAAALAADALAIGCDGVMVPVPSVSEREAITFFRSLARMVPIPIAVYNTEKEQFRSISGLRRLQQIELVFGIKDSSMNAAFFAETCAMRRRGELRLQVWQCLEHMMRVPAGCDGHVVALANAEPALCAKMLRQNSADVEKRIKQLFWTYNLGGNWYVTLKSILQQRGVLRSAEETNPAIRPD